MSSSADCRIRTGTPADAPAIAHIYNHYIRHSIVTFEEQEITAEAITQRMATVAALSLPWLVAESAGEIVGYAYANSWRERVAYRYSVESSVYLAHDCTGRGFGRVLYRALLDELSQGEVHTVIGGISLPNPASIALHESLGFQKTAHFREVGYKFRQWIDVGYWQWQPGSDFSDGESTDD